MTGEPLAERVMGIHAEHVSLLWNLRCDDTWTMCRRAEDVSHALCTGDTATAARLLAAMLADLDPHRQRTAESLLQLCRRDGGPVTDGNYLNTVAGGSNTESGTSESSDAIS